MRRWAARTQCFCCLARSRLAAKKSPASFTARLRWAADNSVRSRVWFSCRNRKKQQSLPPNFRANQGNRRSSRCSPVEFRQRTGAKPKIAESTWAESPYLPKANSQTQSRRFWLARSYFRLTRRRSPRIPISLLKCSDPPRCSFNARIENRSSTQRKIWAAI